MNNKVFLLIFICVNAMSSKAQIDVSSLYIPDKRIVQVTIMNNSFEEIVIINNSKNQEGSRLNIGYTTLAGKIIEKSRFSLTYNKEKERFSIKPNQKYTFEFYPFLMSKIDTGKIKAIDIDHFIRGVKINPTDSAKKRAGIYRKKELLFLPTYYLAK